MKASAGRRKEQVDELGIPIRLHYWLIAGFQTATGFTPFAMSFLPHGEPLANPGVRVMAGIAVVAGPIVMLYGHLRGYPWQKRTYHVAAGTGIFLLSFAAMYTGSLRPTLIASMIVPPMAVAYFLPPLHALPHLLVGTTSITVVAAYGNEPNAGLHAAVMGFVVAAGSMLVMMIKLHVGKALEENKRFSETDPLTGVANLHRLETRLGDDLARFERDGESFALIELDLDEFKEVNDRYSHTVGDEALIAAARAISGEIDPLDLVVRRGGDEFLVVVARAAERDIDELTKRIADAIADARRAICDDIMPTASIAYALPQEGDTPDDLIRRADEALHTAKSESHAARDRKSTTEPHDKAHVASQRVSDARVKQTMRWTGGRRAASASKPRDPIHAATAFAWRGASLLMIAGCATIVLPGVFGIAEVPLTTIPVVLIFMANFVVAPILWAMSRRSAQSTSMSLALVYGTITLLAIAGIATPGIALPTIDLLLLVVFVHTYLLPARHAAVAGLVTATVYMVYLYAFNDPEPIMRASVTFGAAATVAALMVTARKRTVELAAENEAMARTDALTGLPNLRRLRDRLADEIRRCETTGEHFALMMLDLDDFKSVNDLYSHSVGDQTIVAVADAISASVRGSDMPARRGGDEFAVVLTDTDRESAAETAARIATAVERARLAICPDITPNASIGWAFWQPGETVDQLLTRADEHLHAVRGNARHRRGEAARTLREGTSRAS